MTDKTCFAEKISKTLNFFAHLVTKLVGDTTMKDSEEKFDEKILLKVTDRLSDDLKTLFKPQLPVPPEVDRAVMDQAHRHLVRKSRPRRLLRWVAPTAAAAAIIILVFMLEPSKQRSPVQLPVKTKDIRSSLALAVIPADIDLNGRVDILDAFKLARHIESTPHPDAKWDINGDGLVNRDDVDSVAFAAVRLDKGVL